MTATTHAHEWKRTTPGDDGKFVCRECGIYYADYLTDRAGGRAQPAFAAFSSGRHLSAGDGMQIPIPARSVLDACDRYEAGAWFASPAEKAIAASQLVAELRALCEPKPRPFCCETQAEYDFYTTLMEQAEERKS